MSLRRPSEPDMVQFEYRVMPFWLTNAPATFQAYMDDFVVCYLNDILIYSEDPAHYEGHVTEVLERLRKYGLYCKAEKREFSVKNWPTPASAKDMQVLVGFMNFNRHFVKKHAKVTFNRRFAKEIEGVVRVYRGSRHSYPEGQTHVYQGDNFAAL
jgi:hypothetical protein